MGYLGGKGLPFFSTTLLVTDGQPKDKATAGKVRSS